MTFLISFRLKETNNVLKKSERTAIKMFHRMTHDITPLLDAINLFY